MGNQPSRTDTTPRQGRHVEYDYVESPYIRVRPAVAHHHQRVLGSLSRVTEAQVQEVVEFTGASPDVARRVIADFHGDVHAASESLLITEGREIMCFTIPDGSHPGQAVQVQTPRGMVEVTIPDGLSGGDTLAFRLPIPSSRPAVVTARPVQSALPSRSNDGSANAILETTNVVPFTEYPQAVPSSPVTQIHANIILDRGYGYPMARPYYGYRGFYDPYYYYDPWAPALFSSLFLFPLLWSPLFLSPLLWW